MKVRGHERLEKAFAHVLATGRLAHAYLFTGPKGVGKHLFAVELARALLCESPKAGDSALNACGTCASCLLVDGQTHPDLLDVAKPAESLELPIETVRELCASFGLKPARGRRKVAILDDVDDLNEAAANCFLKTLEEPPPGSVLLLIGTSADRQLATILSRCQVVPFEALPEAVVVDLLRANGVDAAAWARLARMSRGSVGDALALADPELWTARTALVKSLSQPKPDSVELAKTWMKFVEDAGSESAAQRSRASLLLRLVIEFLQDGLRRSAGCAVEPADPNDQPLLQALSSRLDPDRLLDVLDRAFEGDHHIDRKVQLVLAVEGLADSLGHKMR